MKSDLLEPTAMRELSQSDQKRRVLTRQVDRVERRLQAMEKLSQIYTRRRWIVALGGLLLTWLCARLFGTEVGCLVLAASAVGFVWVAVYHQRVKASLQHHRIWRDIKSTHLARVNRDWANIPLPAEALVNADHQFATDLNLVGARSILHLIDTTISVGGSDRLRSWLLYPNLDPKDIRARQEYVRELRPLSTFRDRLALYGARAIQDSNARLEGEQVLVWLESESTSPMALRPWLFVLIGLSGLTITLYLLQSIGFLPRLWPYSLVLYLGCYAAQAGAVRDLFDDAFRLEQVLKRFQAVFAYLETRHYDPGLRLSSLCEPFWRTEPRPSTALKRMVRLAGAASTQKANIFGVVLNLLVPWDLCVSYRFQQCKAAIKPQLPLWIETWHELEALNALAQFGYLNPDYHFPEIMPREAGEDEAALRVEALGHPLLPYERRVCNDVTFNHLGELLMITGSNMSGKSTFLRTLGANLSLSYVGAPVNAALFHAVPFRLFTCINVSDSVTDGISYFYSEVRRLKALLQALHAVDANPVFFLIDEIFRGTNNRERLLGSRAYIHALTRGHGVGAISTHDLDLVNLVEEVPVIRNYHFCETIVNGHMVFDYRLRSGPCPTTNALTIMQMEGLPVSAVGESSSSAREG